MENPCPGLIPGACGFVTQFRLGTEFDTQVFEAVPQNAPSTKDTWISRKSNMFDFLDIQVSLVDGAFWGTASKTCVSNSVPSLNCVTNPQAPGISPGQGFSIREVKGPPLFLNR